MFFLFCQQDFQRQSLVREDINKVNEVFEKMKDGFASWTVPRRNHWPVRFRPPDQSLAERNRLHDNNRMPLQQISDFVTDCAERCLLNFKQFTIDDSIDPKSIDLNFHVPNRSAVEQFEFAVKCRFHDN